MPASSRKGISLLRAAALRWSETVTWAPRRRKNSAAASPDLPRPTTSTFLPLSSIANVYQPKEELAQFQGGEGKECEHQCADPETNDYFRFRPAHQLKMVMQRRHLENTL